MCQTQNSEDIEIKKCVDGRAYKLFSLGYFEFKISDKNNRNVCGRSYNN